MLWKEHNPSDNLDFGLLASRTVKTNFSCFTLPGLWHFDIVAMEN